MSYTVVWEKAAESTLAQLWLDATDRRAVSDAANAIDALLRRDPFGQGESRSGLVRVTFEASLIALFEIHEDDRLVRVLQVSGSARNA